MIEVFGDTLEDGSAAIGAGIKAIRDPGLEQEFSAERMPIDVARPHTYAVDWHPGRVDFYVDGERIRTAGQAPDYPMQLIIGLFDFPERARPDSRSPSRS